MTELVSLIVPPSGVPLWISWFGLGLAEVRRWVRLPSRIWFQRGISLGLPISPFQSWHTHWVIPTTALRRCLFPKCDVVLRGYCNAQFEARM